MLKLQICCGLFSALAALALRYPDFGWTTLTLVWCTGNMCIVAAGYLGRKPYAALEPQGCEIH